MCAHVYVCVCACICVYVCVRACICVCVCRRVCAYTMYLCQLQTFIVYMCNGLSDPTKRWSKTACARFPLSWYRSHLEEDSLQCLTPSGIPAAGFRVNIMAKVDGWLALSAIHFTYLPNPRVESVSPPYSFQRSAGHSTVMWPTYDVILAQLHTMWHKTMWLAWPVALPFSGGIPITVSGVGFSNIQAALIVLTHVQSQLSRRRRQISTTFSVNVCYAHNTVHYALLLYKT